MILLWPPKLTGINKNKKLMDLFFHKTGKKICHYFSVVLEPFQFVNGGGPKTSNSPTMPFCS